MTPALGIAELVKTFGRRKALDGLSLEVPRGTTTGLVGSNGAGKTTAMNIAAGLLKADRGTVDFNGEGLFDPLRHRGRLSILPQDATMPRYARARDLLGFYARLQGMDGNAARREAARCLEWVNLAERAGSAVGSLSHGMKRRLMIAQAFLGTPELVLLDEPLSGLDPREVSNLRQVLAKRRRGSTILISSHNLHEIELICDRVIFMEHGYAVRQDSLDALIGRDTVTFYRLENGDPPLKRLREIMPAADFEWRSGDKTLRCRYSGGTAGTAEINRLVLDCLLRAGAGVLEVKRGERLEAAYFSADKR